MGAHVVHEGVSFQAWAFVLAGLDAGLAIEDLLAHLDLDLSAARWHRADEAFNEALLDDVEAGGTLSERLDDAMRGARRSWTRPIPPLDADLRSWLDFFRAWAVDGDPIAFLGARGLRASDMHRLHEQWTARLAADRTLQAEAFAILEAPPGLVPETHPEPARLVTVLSDHGGGPDQTRPCRASAGHSALPFVAGEPAPAHPPLSVALPPPPPRSATPHARAEDTRVMSSDGGDRVPTLPFAQRAEGTTVVDPPPPVGDAPPPVDDGVPGLLVRSDDFDPRRDFSVQRYAELCVDLIEAAGEEEAVLRRYGITALQKAELDAYWTETMSGDTTTWLAWDRACAERRAANVEPVVRESDCS